jgi:beta-1,4-mannosyl-glycoprotein beta-1,4-N-acetylglucosaminyltransferase
VKTVSTFPFFNELDILEIHLETASSVVDHFVITESRFSHAGLPKPLYLTENIHLFEKFRDKITIQVIEEFPPGVSLFQADWFQRDCAKALLERIMSPDDLLIYGDVDEIPRPSAVIRAARVLRDNPDIQVAHLAQDLYYYLNLRETSGTLLSFMGEYPNVKEKKWLGTTIQKWSSIGSMTMTDLRYPERKKNGVRIPYGGWHFSWVGSEDRSPAIDRVRAKLENTAHQEFKSARNLRKLERRVENMQDLVGRRTARFKAIQDLQFLPDYVLANLEKFEHTLRK